MKTISILFLSLVSLNTWAAFVPQVNTVPEPATLPLVGLGIAALLVIHRRKNKKK